MLAMAPGLRFEGDVLVVDGAAALAQGMGAGAFFDEVARIERASRRPLTLWIDIRGVPAHAFEERGLTYRRRAEWLSRRVAVVGESRFQEFVINFLVDATGHTSSRYFTDERAAWAWLAEGARAA